jgi:hypothetical protein
MYYRTKPLRGGVGPPLIQIFDFVIILKVSSFGQTVILGQHEFSF